jgi:hypothetical protein
MAVEQTILFTVIPRGIAVDTDTLPVSVTVSPRLRGASTLGEFADWLRWTRRVANDGLTLTLRCGASQVDVAVDPAPLQPDLWDALFDEHTLVRSHEFDDYDGRAVMSYGVRDALSVVKSVYQQASVALALPPGDEGRQRGSNRWILRELLSNLAVHWSDEEGRRLRVRARDQAREVVARDPRELDDEGLLRKPPTSTARTGVAVDFAVYHHMPTPEGDLEQPDWSKQLDFHQALSSLEDYPALQRALGIVFELELPVDLVPVGSFSPLPELSVAAVRPGWDWSPTPSTPELATACAHLALDAGRRGFLTAPRFLAGKQTVADPPVLGLLDLDERLFGLAQVDVDGAMHKAIILAETWSTAGPPGNLDPNAEPEAAPHPEVFDPEATLPALRSGGFSLFADGRAQQLLHTIKQNQAFNAVLESGGKQPDPFYAEDLVRGYRLDVWDSHTGDWHSLHLRNATYGVQDGPALAPVVEEGFVQLAVTQPAPGTPPEENDLYLHEAIARWAGWSLAVEMPGLHLSRFADPDAAIPKPGDAKYDVNEPVTPFKLTPTFEIVKGTLPRLRFGRRYRFRARAVDLAGEGLRLGETIADELSDAFALPRDPEGVAYLRYEPVPAPIVVIREQGAVTGPGSAVDRLVIRTFNATPAQDGDTAAPAGSERHVLPPRASVEMGERLGMFDTPGGELASDAATWKLIADRDKGELDHPPAFDVAGKSNDYPIEAADAVAPLPYLPDPLAAGAALRDLPGTESGTIAHVAGASAAGTIAFDALKDPNPRGGSAALVSFDGADWQKALGFRIVLADAPAAGGAGPSWDPKARALTVELPKGSTSTVPLSSHVAAAELALLGIWKWLRDYVDARAESDPWPATLHPGAEVDRIAHVLQRAVEGGHWMLTPPTLLTLVHAVQQPLGTLELIALRVEHGFSIFNLFGAALQTKPSAGREDPTELATITAWRQPGAVDAYLVGGLRLHAASTARVDLHATWQDPVDDPGDDANDPTSAVAHHHARVDELLLPNRVEDYVYASGPEPRRAVGYYDPEHDQIAFVRSGDILGRPGAQPLTFEQAAPRHLIGDTKHHRVSYTATGASRYQEYFEQDAGLDFTRTSEPVVVDVPASARPLAPDPVYVVPTFGWQRQTDTNIKRSVRFGGGLRVYLRRPWFSSGAGELLGVTLWRQDRSAPSDAERDHFKAYMTQWGMDPIWQTGDLGGTPSIASFPDAVAWDAGATLEEATARGADGAPGSVDVVGFQTHYDPTRKLWFADLTIDAGGATYMPFVRLALVRYQPSALPEAKISRVVLADFAQLTPDRCALVTSDQYHPRRLSVVVSGVAPRGPAPRRGVPPTHITVRVQERDRSLASDLGWADAPAGVARVDATHDGPVQFMADLAMWSGSIEFARSPEPGRFRILVEEREHIPGKPTHLRRGEEPPGRLVYAEAFAVDAALVPDD